MKVGDLVVLEYKGVDLDEKDRLKIGIVVNNTITTLQLAKVLWSNGEQRWCLNEHLQVINESR